MIRCFSLKISMWFLLDIIFSYPSYILFAQILLTLTDRDNKQNQIAIQWIHLIRPNTTRTSQSRQSDLAKAIFDWIRSSRNQPEPTGSDPVGTSLLQPDPAWKDWTGWIQLKVAGGTMNMCKGARAHAHRKSERVGERRWSQSFPWLERGGGRKDGREGFYWWERGRRQRSRREGVRKIKKNNKWIK